MVISQSLDHNNSHTVALISLQEVQTKSADIIISRTSFFTSHLLNIFWKP